MLHPAGLAAERLATFMLGLVAYMFGWAIRNGAVWPKWLAWIAWVVAVACAVVGLVFNEMRPYLFYAQALVVTWLAVVAVVMLTERRPAPPAA
jgi:peptidoglycan/LPS O-acetylase OafA/YrhL